jgi:hypothetical protein
MMFTIFVSCIYAPCGPYYVHKEFEFNVYHMVDKDESDLVMISNESETDSNPRKRQGTLLSFFTNPIVKKSNY